MPTDTFYPTRSPLAYINRFSLLGASIFRERQKFCWTGHWGTRKQRWPHRRPNRLPCAATLSLFDIRVVPIATYETLVIWKDLTMENFKHLNCPKASFHRGTVALYMIAWDRLTYLLTDSSLLFEILHRCFKLPTVETFRTNVRNRGANSCDDWWRSSCVGCNEKQQVAEQLCLLCYAKLNAASFRFLLYLWL